MMKTFAILYSATSALDYRFVASPSKEDIPKGALNKFQKTVKGLLSNERPIEKPKWVLVKEFVNGVQYVLWGVACQNSVMFDNFSFDKKKRSIQCFVGVVISNADSHLRLPYDTNAFTSLFETIMEQQWESLEQKASIYEIELPFSHVTIGATKVSGINLDSSICRFFPGTYNGEQLFSEALASISNVSVASGIQNKSEVISPEYAPLFNAILLKTTGEIKDEAITKCSSTYSLNNNLCDDCLKADDSVDVVIDNHDEDNYSFQFFGYQDFQCQYFTLSLTGHVNEGLELSADDYPIEIRNFKNGDIIKTMGGTKKVSRLFIDNKIPFYLYKF